MKLKITVSKTLLILVLVVGAVGIGSGVVTLSTETSVHGVLNMDGNRITNLADPTNGQDVATKSWVEDYVDSYSGSGS